MNNVKLTSYYIVIINVIENVKIYRYIVKLKINRYLNLYKKGKIKLDGLITKRFVLYQVFPARFLFPLSSNKYLQHKTLFNEPKRVREGGT